MNLVTLGADPEVFVADTRTGEVLPICGMLGGTKEKPLPMEGYPEGFYVQEDNVMAEFNVPATRHVDGFVTSIHSGLEYIRNAVPKHIDVVSGSEFLFSHYKLSSQQAKQFGCSPDLDAYNLVRPQRPTVDPDALLDSVGAWRIAGGHLHLGVHDTIRARVPSFVMAMLCDALIGLPAVSVDKQNHRRGLYGQAGTYRETSYGIEYRVLSNFWVFDRFYTQEVAARMGRVGTVVSRMDEKNLKSVVAEAPWEDVKNAINTQDEEQASSLYAYFDKRLSATAVRGR